MESFEATKVVYSRILELESEAVTRKIIGYIYLQDHADREMIRLAFGPDNQIQNWIHKAKIELGLSPNPVVSPPISPSVQFSLHSAIPIGSPRNRRVQVPYWEQLLQMDSDFPPQVYPHSVPEDFRYLSQNQFVGVEDQLEPANPEVSSFPNDNYYKESPLPYVSIRGRRHSTGLPEFPVKVCHYFNKGFCKHGSNCRFFHGQSFPDSTYTRGFDHFNSKEFNDDHTFSPGSLEKLELEITEILKSRRGSPVSIASLPMIYYERYGKTLQAEGYLTESQRHGKAGYSLTKLLARLKNSIRLIDRPHGQHCVVLAEDAQKYMDNRYERNDPGPIVSGSRQIYLTFPAESTFSEEDVSNYFSTFGPVQDVRIPCQQKRMFGFVTFENADTVQMILAKGNPHFVCGARVLVKPYREKSKLIDRKYSEKFENLMCYHSQHADVDYELQARFESSRFLRKQQVIDDHEAALELEMLHLSQLHLAQKPCTNHSYFDHSTMDELKIAEDHSKFPNHSYFDHSTMDELKFAEDYSKFPSPKHFNCLLDVLKSSSSNDDNPKHAGANYPDQDNSQGINLPDSPFASSMPSSISAV